MLIMYNLNALVKTLKSNPMNNCHFALVCYLAGNMQVGHVWALLLSIMEIQNS